MSGQHGAIGRPLTEAEVDYFATALRRADALHKQADAVLDEVRAHAEALTRRERLRLVS